MALYSRSHLLPLLVAFLLINLSAGDLSQKLVGDWRPVNPKDPIIVEIGKFAVKEYNKKYMKGKMVLKYGQVLKGESQVVAGTNYKLFISASVEGNSNNYQAIVWDQPWKHFRNLTSFIPAN